MGDTRGPLEATGRVLGHWGPPEAAGVHWEILWVTEGHQKPLEFTGGAVGDTRGQLGALNATGGHWEILGSTRGQQKQLGEPLGGTGDHWWGHW